MKLSTLLSTISAVERIFIVDADGNTIIFEGMCQNFRATRDDAEDYLNRTVDTIGASDSTIFITLSED